MTWRDCDLTGRQYLRNFTARTYDLYLDHSKWPSMVLYTRPVVPTTERMKIASS